MDAPTAGGSSDRVWEQIRPELDDVLHKLNQADRTAVVLRFLEARSLREVGAMLGLNENAARMRVERALDRLRGLLAQRGITSTESGLAAALAVGAVTPAPAAWASTIAGTVLASSMTASATPRHLGGDLAHGFERRLTQSNKSNPNKGMNSTNTILWAEDDENQVVLFSLHVIV